MTDAEFRRLNERRLDLLEKQHAGFTEEERSRPFTVPGWRAECDRRERAALTDDERAELARLQKVVGDELAARFPMPQLPSALQKLLDEHGL